MPHIPRLDIVDFYPSISEQLLMNAISYAKHYTNILEKNKEIILHSKTILPFDNKQPWVKRTNSFLFDVTMGSCDKTETCKLVGLYILNKLTDVYKNNSSINLYRVDGLVVFQGIGLD